jgi:hypothetical protein
MDELVLQTRIGNMMRINAYPDPQHWDKVRAMNRKTNSPSTAWWTEITTGTSLWCLSEIKINSADELLVNASSLDKKYIYIYKVRLVLSIWSPVDGSSGKSQKMKFKKIECQQNISIFSAVIWLTKRDADMHKQKLFTSYLIGTPEFTPSVIGSTIIYNYIYIKK